MIRVNLLPIKQARRRSAGRMQLIVFVGIIVVQLVAFAVIYATRNEELSQVQQKLGEHQTAVKNAERQVSDAKKLEADAERYAQQLSILTKLEQDRIGPVKVLDELQAILSPPRNEEDRFSQLQRNWNVEWDTRRLWLQKLTDKDNTFDIEGFAGNADDVAEFLQRLTTARHFGDVQLDYVEAITSSQKQDSSRSVKFRVTGTISYAGKDGQDS